MSGNPYDEVRDFGSLDTCEDLSFPLFTDPEADPYFAGGQLRTQYEVTDDGVPIFYKEESDYTLSVQRLLWADGWRDKDQKPSQEATLVVLKFVFRTVGSIAATKLQKVRASLRFFDADESRGRDPEVAAWAPFHQTERFNQTAVHVQNTTVTSAGTEIGYGGSKISLGRSKQGEVSWDRTCFDEGRAVQEFNTRGRPHGISWHLTQNNLQNQGIVPEFWAAVLVSRASPDPYLARFSINANSGTFERLTLKAKQAIGLRDDGSSFSVTPTPGRVKVCNLEGLDIIKCVDLEHLGKLVDHKTSTRLSVIWGPQYQLGTMEGTPRKADGPMAFQKVDTGALFHEASPERSAHAQATTAGPQPGVAHSPPAAWNDALTPTVSAGSTRLVALETRLAQVEARLAAQDNFILQLRQAQLATDIQMFRLEQVSKHATD